MNEQIQPSKGAPLFNPGSPEFIANPYPSYHLLRETEPMHYMSLGLYVRAATPTSPRSCATSVSARTLSVA